ncbi:MAG TPA: hemerythrin domain-containing protein [Acidimicrobiales bacterium]
MSPTQRSPARTPDTTMFTVLHRAMRRDAARLAAAVATPGDGRQLASLSRWYRGYRSALTEHHRIEDQVFFPVLAERVPSFAAHGPRLGAEHDLLEDALDVVQMALAALGGEPPPGRAGPDAGTDASANAGGRASSPARDRAPSGGRGRRPARDPGHDPVRKWAVAATRELSDLLDRHLSFEDADVVPLYVRHFGADEYAEVERRALKLASTANLPFTVPWALTAATEAERSRLLGDAPLAFRLLWWASRRRYGRLADRALAPAGPGPGGHDTRGTGDARGTAAPGVTGGVATPGGPGTAHDPRSPHDIQEVA